MSIILRVTVVYFVLWVATRGMGKRELAEMSPFELILLVILGDLIQQGVTEEDRSVTGAILAVLTITFWVLLFARLTFRSSKAERFFVGVPVVVITNGEPVEETMRHEQVSLDEIKEEARSQGIDDLRRVRVGILEPSGTFSFVVEGGPNDQQPRVKTLGPPEPA